MSAGLIVVIISVIVLSILYIKNLPSKSETIVSGLGNCINNAKTLIELDKCNDVLQKHKNEVSYKLYSFTADKINKRAIELKELSNKLGE